MIKAAPGEVRGHAATGLDELEVAARDGDLNTQPARVGGHLAVTRADTPALDDTVAQGAVPETLTIPAVRGRRRGRHRARASSRSRTRLRQWPLPVILAVQALLSLRLVWSNTAFPDEALYLWAGHLEWQHWLHGTPLPAFPTYFSGAPTVYPPLGAAADMLGGLAAARVLSLCFMLTATVLLCGMTARLFGRNAGWFAAAVFAATAGTQFLGAFATYDAMALMLLAVAAWLAVSAAGRGPAWRVLSLAAAGGALVAADAAKYAAALWNPVVFALAFLAAWNARGWKSGARAAAIMLGVFAALLAGALRLGGHPYWRGIGYTTLSRQHGNASAHGILVDTIGWVGIAGVLALIGVLVVARTESGVPVRLAAVTLAGAIVLAPANQARIQVFTSLFKHVDFGAWFAAATAGVALASLARAVPAVKRNSAAAAAAAAAAVAAVSGVLLSATHFSSWPASSSFVTAMRPVLAGARGPVLAADNGNVLEYYLPGDITRVIFYGPWFFRYHDPGTGRYLTGLPAYADAIRHRFFSVIALSFSDSQATDVRVSADIARYGGYRLVSVLPYRAAGAPSAYRIWVLDGGAA